MNIPFLLGSLSEVQIQMEYGKLVFREVCQNGRKGIGVTTELSREAFGFLPRQWQKIVPPFATVVCDTPFDEVQVCEKIVRTYIAQCEKVGKKPNFERLQLLASPLTHTIYARYVGDSTEASHKYQRDYLRILGNLSFTVNETFADYVRRVFGKTPEAAQLFVRNFDEYICRPTWLESSNPTVFQKCKTLDRLLISVVFK